MVCSCRKLRVREIPVIAAPVAIVPGMSSLLYIQNQHPNSVRRNGKEK